MAGGTGGQRRLEGQGGGKFVKAYLELCELINASYAAAPRPPKLVAACSGAPSTFCVTSVSIPVTLSM